MAFVVTPESCPRKEIPQLVVVSIDFSYYLLIFRGLASFLLLELQVSADREDLATKLRRRSLLAGDDSCA
jgi:hypothetical protein